jgi:hypothetical protein
MPVNAASGDASSQLRLGNSAQRPTNDFGIIDRVPIVRQLENGLKFIVMRFSRTRTGSRENGESIEKNLHRIIFPKPSRCFPSAA